MKRIRLVYRDENGAPDERTLMGRRVGYGFNPPEEEHAMFRIWADDVTFGVPFGRIISYEIDEQGENDGEA